MEEELLREREEHLLRQEQLEREEALK